MNANSLWTLLGLAVLWVLYAWLYRSYRVDLFRQRVFVLRDELFDLAADGKIQYAHPAYGILRTTLNGSIRFAHRCSFLEFAFFAVLTHRARRELRNVAGTFDDRWEAATSDLDIEVQRRLRAIRGKLHYEVVEQMILTSPVLCLTIVPVATWLVIRACANNLASLVRRVLGDGLPDRLREEYDIAAYVSGSSS